MMQRRGNDTARDPKPTALIDARVRGAWLVVGGLTCVARLVRSFELAGVRHIVVFSLRPLSRREIRARCRDTVVESVCLGADGDLFRAAVDRIADEELVYADGNLVVDRRIIELLVSQGAPVAVRLDCPGENSIGLGRVSRRALSGRPELGGAEKNTRVIDPARTSTYSEEMRGHVPVLVERVTNRAGAARVTRALIDATQKHAMDAPARWLDPPVENALLRLVAPTPVRPDHITYACLVVGLAAAWLLGHGALSAALPLMYLVEWLDGVDGKLARLRLEYSAVGAWESYFDFVYENAWWVALTAWFGAGTAALAGTVAGAALIGGNLIDEIAYTVGHRVLGTSLDLLSSWDRRFRLVAGRRNIYVAILLLATVLRHSFVGFALAGAWALVTGCVHAVRLLSELRRREIVGLRRLPRYCRVQVAREKSRPR